MKSTRPLLISVVLVSLYGLFAVWYGGDSTPLTQAEVDGLIARMQQNAGLQGQPESVLLQEFRTLAQGDDGQEFYNVNLIRFREKALYPPGSPFSDDVMEANARYNRLILPYLFKYGAIPIMTGDVAGRFLHPEGNDDWDMVGVVRYRNRRALLEMAVELAGKGVGEHKWAAIDETQAFPIKPGITFAQVRLGVAALLLGVWLRLVGLRMIEDRGGRGHQN